MTDLWTWSGKFYGRREGNNLIHRRGRCTGVFHGIEVYAHDRRYLGELMADRLIRDSRKALYTGPGAPKTMHRPSWSYNPKVGYAMYPGCEDFPEPK